MTGHLERRAKGSWRIVIEAGRNPQTGRRRRIVRSIRGNRRRAEEEMRRLLHELESGNYVEPSKLTVAEYLRRWLEESCRPNISPYTLQNYRGMVENQIIPQLGAIELARLQPLHLQEFYNWALREGRLPGRGESPGLSARTVELLHTVIRKALGQAVNWQLLSRNVADAVQPPRPKRRRKLGVLGPEDAGRLLQAFEGRALYPLVYAALATGLRRGELLALRWSDIDLAKKVIRVQRSMMKQGAEVIWKEPKTARSRRSVAMSEGLVTVLRAHKVAQLERRLQVGEEYTDGDLVFCRADGLPYNPHSVTRMFLRTARRAGFDGLRLHDLRHSHATLLLSQGVHPKIVQERLGHEAISTTLDTYSHVVPGLQEAAAAKLDEILTVSDGHRLGTI